MSTDDRSPALLKKANRLSAGLLMYRFRGNSLEVLLVHLGGPFWTRKDQWFIPKGALEAGEEELAAAMREFAEETGITPKPPLLELGSVQHKSGKRVIAWAFAGDTGFIRSGMITPFRKPKHRELLAWRKNSTRASPGSGGSSSRSSPTSRLGG